MILCLSLSVTTARNYFIGNWTTLLVRIPAAYMQPVLVRVISMSCVARPHNADCFAPISPAVPKATER